jgi:hypothetical protein
MREVRSEIDIDASPERVWQVLTDFASYPDWNSFIVEASGRPTAGERLEVRIQPPGGRAMTFRPTVLKAEPGVELRWLGRFLFPGIFDGEHSFLIEPLVTGRVRLHQDERFTGVAVPLFGSTLARTREGFVAMNQALKARAEALSA